MKLSEILRVRGYIYQHSASLEEIVDGDKRTLYLGVDPSADSLHVGSLQMLLILRRFNEAGHRVILLVGGGTGMIGDPSGKSEERNLLDLETVVANAAAMKRQVERISGIENLAIVNNADWLGKLKFLEFLRDIGKFFTVNAMIKKDTVKNRLDAESPISYTEFAYSILQGYDFLHLFENEGCTLQIGASDQWGNIMTGIELIRKKSDAQAYGITAPLLINKATGKKFGKSEGGAVWLDANKTSVFDFYQFWINTSDADVEEYLLKMTLLPKADIDAIVAEQKENPALRVAQKNLAFEVTALVHGEAEAEKVARSSEELFSGQGNTEHAPTVQIEAETTIVDALVLSNLAASKREARQFIADGAVQLNGEKVSEDRAITDADFADGKALLKKGKRSIVALTK